MTIYIDNYKIDSIIINLYNKLSYLENMEQDLNNMYYSNNTSIVNDTISNNISNNIDFIDSIGSIIGIFIEKIRTNNSKIDFKSSLFKSLCDLFKKQRNDMVNIVKKIYTNSEIKKKLERELEYLKHTKILLEKKKRLNESLGCDISIIKKILSNCNTLITNKEKDLKSNYYEKHTIWNPTYLMINKYIEDADNIYKSLSKKYNSNNEEYNSMINNEWINSIIYQNNEYKRRMLVELASENIICLVKKNQNIDYVKRT
tara:strand:+ start:308 stop:1081 length:774 start_codon:yes stop_codon:yes gene_type:complete